jgi:hypothetical protein
MEFWYMHHHVRNQHRICIAAPADSVFMFFTPAGEELWVPGWRPRYLHPEGGATCAGMAFTTGEGEEFTLWTLAQFDRGARRSCYARVTPALRLGLVRIGCEPMGGSTDVTVEYEMTALDGRGDTSLAGYRGEVFRDMIDGWACMIHERLPQLLVAAIR